jgi:hypothetical protein
MTVPANYPRMVDTPDRLHWVPEATALAICGVKRPTWTTWAKQNIVERPSDGAYGLDDVIRVALVAELRKVLGADEMAAAWRGLRRGGVADEVMRLVPTLHEDDRLDLVIEPESGRVVLATDDIELAHAVRHPTAPRPVIVLSPAAELCRVTEGFANRAMGGARPKARRRGRPVVVRSIREEAG